ncbi:MULTISPECIES: NADH:ubiquinone reductase (Na(+)-transporting) subunit F [Porphyromonadaceae]|uniref:Na(+)-translocating NADH-quinone reductase subunit F n=1 Tax=Sanguibacteroides justesenii TaxID=1547597 RepID=A0A0C3MCD5_9PORP|nr:MULTISPECIES: NADH:ubiquinone reductase (Na(+)-transporting) subunit F [Porphyromonadaceae]KIO44093.1 Na(+)-translocating NADH-quinone reductase subunit F [Sanguibacteroides justesenii]KIO47249.1 Na(+)-translocating NADH-quinone reductase subunit F [Sanguibacteroides justesenii]MCR9012619.1 NADH:ubiquinone reductase (Na(+)-transporting) subunit F [Gabonibacter chumensis]
MTLLVINTAIVTAGVIVFLIVTLILVGMLLFAKAKLTPKGEVKVSINHGEKEITTEPGSTLLATLGNNKIFLPSACGGKGSCGMCRCQVESGAGSILPTETGFFSYKQQHDNWRLACQVKVKENIEMEIPESVLGIKKWECEVVSNNNISTFLKEFVVKLPEGETLKFKSGGYIQIDVPAIDVDFKDIEVNEKYRADWERMKMFDLKMHNPEATYRAYSMANHPAEGNIIMLNIRIATPPFDKAIGGFAHVNPGICSSYIFTRKPGDKVTISGPYGEFFLRDTNNEMMFIGGGAGMAPMRSHIFNLFKTMHTKRKVTFWYGARALQEAPYVDQFNKIQEENPNFRWTLALDKPDPVADAAGVAYKPGFVHQVIYEQYLKNHENPEDIEYYLCGPPMMIQAVTKMLYDLGVPDENVMYDNFGG